MGNFRNSVLFSIIFTLITGILAFFINKVFSDSLGQENLGILRLFTQLLAYLNLAELGVGAAASATLYRYLNENNIIKINGVLLTVRYFYRRIGFGILILGLLFNFLLPYIINDISIEIFVVWSLYVVGISITYFYSDYPIILTSDQRYQTVLIIRNLIKTTVQILQIYTLIVFESFYLFVAIFVLFNLLEWITFKVIYNNIYGDKYEKGGEKDYSVIEKTKYLFIHNLAGVLIFNTDFIIITKFIGLKIVAIYSSYLMITKFIELIFNSIVNVIRPKIGKIVASCDENKILFYFNGLLVVNIYIAAIIAFVTYYTIGFIVQLWMGNEYILQSSTLLLMSINLFINIFRRTIDIFKEVSGYYNDIHLPVMEGFINLILSLLLVKHYGINGVIFSTVFTNIIFIIIMKPWVFYSKVLKVKFNLYLKSILKYLIVLSFILFVINFSFLSDFSLNYISLFSNSILMMLLITVVFLSVRDFRVLIKDLFKKL
ncbi:lipopolysaccharide biosynthesis protein [Photobacterium damselae]|uniref:lipopolysaccharide biosynthesis protein n=1 Tax=Photobacterium damselae TaxID=38293 RepID=UPI004068790F